MFGTFAKRCRHASLAHKGAKVAYVSVPRCIVILIFVVRKAWAGMKLAWLGF